MPKVWSRNGEKLASINIHLKYTKMGGFPTAVSPAREAVCWGYPERVKTNDVGADEKYPEICKAKD